MRRSLPVFALMLASIWYSQAAWSYGVFGDFQNILQTVKCAIKPGTDYLVCSPKAPDEEAEPTVETTTETYTEREYGEEQVTTTRSEPVEKYRTENSTTERTTDDENNRWVDTTTTTTTIVYEVATFKTVVTPWTDTTYEVTITTTTHEDGTTETERSKPKVAEVVEGEDRVVSNDTHTFQEEVVDVSVTYEPYPESVANLMPSVEIPDAMAVNPDYDYIWSHIQSTDLWVDLSDTRFQECIPPDSKHVEDKFYQFRPMDANNDGYVDYVVGIDCFSDIWWDGINTSKNGVRHWNEPFMFFMCNSEQGFYNCTEEVTGHKNVLNVASDSPGKINLVETIFYDINNDGVLDAIISQGNDNSDGEMNALRRLIDRGDEELLAGIWNLFGYTWEEALEYCKDNYSDIYFERGGCYLYSSQNSLALSGPDGKWEITSLEHPRGFYLSGGPKELYFKDGVYHYNIIHNSADTPGFNWWAFNNETNEFEFVAQGLGVDPESAHYNDYSVAKLPFNRAENWNQYRIKYNGKPTGSGLNPNGVVQPSEWTKVDDFEVKIHDKDYTLSFSGDPNDVNNVCDLWTGDYDKCQLDQIHIIKKDSSGKISKIMEYNLLDWAEDRKLFPMFRVDHRNEVVNEGLQYGTYFMHGFWVNRLVGYQYGYGLMQLETRPDAPWYLIVEIKGDYYMRNPGQEPMEGFIKECANFGHNQHEDEYGTLQADGVVDFDDKRCHTVPLRIIFKYELDFENNTMEYAGPLLDYPFVGDLFLDEFPEYWNATDLNGDGFKDFRLQNEHFMSDDTGRLLWLHKTTEHDPLMPYGRYTEYEKQQFGAQDTHYNWVTGHDNMPLFGDVNNDGIADYITSVNGSMVQKWLNWAIEHPDITVDQNLVDLYPSDSYYLDVVYGQEDIFTELDTLDAVEMQERIDRCIDIWVNYARWDGLDNPGIAGNLGNCYKNDYLDPDGTVPKEPRWD